MQAEQMRHKELQDDLAKLHDVLDSGDMDVFQQERQDICLKWSKVEKLSPIPVDFGYIPEYITIPEALPCDSESLIEFMKTS